MTETARPVFTLLVEVGRKPGDGLPEDCDGAALICYTAAATEDEAVRETVATLKRADLAPLTVNCHGTREEREAEGHDIPEDHQVLMIRAQEENAVIVAQIVPFADEEDAPANGGAEGEHT